MSPYMASLPGAGMGQANALGALNSVQPPPPVPMMSGNLLQMLGGMPDSMPSDPGNILDPMMFGTQAGMGNPDPFGSTPFQGERPLVDQLEGMGLGSSFGQGAQQGQMPNYGGGMAMQSQSPGIDPATLQALLGGSIRG